MYKTLFITIAFCFLLSQPFFAQVTNKEIIAKIQVEQIEDVIFVNSTVSNTTELLKSLRYVFYVYKENLETKNVNRTEQLDRFVLNANEKKILSKTTLNQNTKDKITAVLLIYDSDDNVVAKDRVVVINDDEQDKKTSEVTETIVEEEEYVGLRGIVIEETKTKPGRDFYIDFSSNYRLKEINGKEIVKITEQFSFGRSTIMEVFVGRTVVHRFFVQPTRDFIEKQSEIAIIRVSRQLQNLERQKSLIKQF